MGLSITFVSGARRSGKSAVIQMMVDHLWTKPPHYLRLVKAGSDKKVNRCAAKASRDCRVASARWIEFSEDRIFEILPEALESIHKQDRYGSVVVEADAEPSLRHAYPYDNRVFVMPLPGSIEEVFRNPDRAMTELRKVLDDTSAFASEVFGLFRHTEDVDECHEDRLPLSEPYLRSFLHSPLGDELVTRIQLQPAYHGLVESDVVVINTSMGERSLQTEECIRRVGQILGRFRHSPCRKESLFRCDPSNGDDPVCQQLRVALAPFCQGGH
ncbi:MAG: hypothetical protein HY287_08380 [Planctomycetes bacterium]|nr:hypothetical protein [Planctomycetota bacterium]MBI3834329.1 hypothetical protein [Planctomycetota bacterium]